MARYTHLLLAPIRRTSVAPLRRSVTFPLQLVICAAPAYLERHGMPAGLGDPPSHLCSAFRHPGTSAAANIRAGRLVPLLTQHLAEKANFVLYYGSRTAQPLRVRRFIAFAVERLADGAGLLLSARELAAAEAKARKRFAKRRARSSA